MLLLFYLCFAATPDFNSHSVRRQSVTTVSCVIWWVTSLTDLGAELRLKGSLFHITPSPSEFKSKWLQASHLREKNGETGVICRPVAATGQLVGHCIGGKVSSKLHLQWPGTPEAPAATCASGAKELSGLHKESASRNYQHQAQMEKETQEQPEVYPRCPRWINQEAKAYTEAYAPAAPTKGCRLKHHKHHGISKNNISWNCLNVTEYLFWNIVLFQILVDKCK